MLTDVLLEGPTDVELTRRLLGIVGVQMGAIYGLGGKHLLDERIAAYNHAAKHACWFVLRDLDQDAICPAHLTRQLVPHPGAKLVFRIAVRASEAWLMGDAERLSAFLGVSRTRVPTDPEALPRPKRTLVNLARFSRRRAIREDMVPESGTSSEVGPGYTARVNEFAAGHWRPEVAARAAPSLSRCIVALRRRLEQCPELLEETG